MLTLPIHIGNVSLDKKQHTSKKAALSSPDEAKSIAASASTTDNASSATTPKMPPHTAPKPAPRPAPRARMSSHSSPSAPPADYREGAEGGNLMNDGFPNKRQSQMVSPNAFSYAPGLFFSQNQQNSVPVTGAAAPYPPENSSSSIPAPQVLPPNYISAYPQGQLETLILQHPGTCHNCRWKHSPREEGSYILEQILKKCPITFHVIVLIFQ